MPVRRRQNRRSHRVDFEVTPEMMDAFRAFIDSDERPGWPEQWHLHGLLADAGILATPFCPPFVWHPRSHANWDACPDAVAIYRRLVAAN